MKVFLNCFFSILFLIPVLFSCQTEKSTEKDQSEEASIDKRYEEVVAEHDVVMPKISKMEVLQEKLRKELKALAGDAAEEKKEILDLLSLLKKGHDGMFDWMNNFKNKHLDKDFYENSSEAELREYLNKEERKIKEVGETMLEGIKQSEEYLNQ